MLLIYMEVKNYSMLKNEHSQYLVCHPDWCARQQPGALTLARLGMDPAISAGPFLTTTTDVLGFFSFLELATLFLM
jgi:hypothetical protein